MEIYGPPTYKGWAKCHNIFISLVIMFDVVSGALPRDIRGLSANLMPDTPRHGTSYIKRVCEHGMNIRAG